MRWRITMLRMMMSRGRTGMMLRMTMLSQDLGPHFAPARKVDMHLDMSEESEELRVEIYRKSVADHTLRETA